MWLYLFNTILFHPRRTIATALLLVALLLAVGYYWPGWAEAKWRAVGAVSFLVGLYDWARQGLGRDGEQP